MFFGNNIAWSCFTIHQGNPTGLIIAETKGPLQPSAAKLHGGKVCGTLGVFHSFFCFMTWQVWLWIRHWDQDSESPVLPSRSAHAHGWWGWGSIEERGYHNTIRQRASSEECSLHGQFTANCCEAYLRTTKPVADMLRLVKPITNIKLHEMWIAVITLPVPPQY